MVRGLTDSRLFPCFAASWLYTIADFKTTPSDRTVVMLAEIIAEGIYKCVRGGMQLP